MSRIKLRNLLNLTEQAPQPPVGSPVPAPVAPPIGGLPLGQADPTQPTPEEPPVPETPDTDAPDPENPSEYDFTKDFRAFEDKKNKAEAESKKVLLDKMNKRLLNKTIVANASRGYGQPKTDYTIENVKKVSVEFWYKDYVVIVTDENDKKYFLTPGINVKIEGEGSEPAPGAEPEASPDAQGQAPEGQPQPEAQPPAAGEELPNNLAPAGQPQPEIPAPQPQAAQPQQAPAPAPAPEQQPPQQQPDPMQIHQQKKKKKKLPLAEWLQKDLNKFLMDYMSSKVKDKYGYVNFIPYVSEAKNMITEGQNITKIKYKLLIPENHMISRVDVREIKLAAIDTINQKTHFGKDSRGSVNMIKNGRYYLLEYIKEVKWIS